MAETEDEFVMAEVRVILHDVPEDRPVAERHHGLRYVVRVVAKAHPEAAAKQDDFHSLCHSVVSSRRDRPMQTPDSASARGQSFLSDAIAMTYGTEFVAAGPPRPCGVACRRGD